MVAGSAFKFQTNDSKSKSWSSGSALFDLWLRGTSWPSSAAFDGVLDLLELTICDESDSNVISKLAPGELLLVSCCSQSVLACLRQFSVAVGFVLHHYAVSDASFTAWHLPHRCMVLEDPISYR
jgi:hypothetical protein